MTKKKLAVSLSPLSLLALAACGGGSSDGVSSAAALIANGNVQNGPLGDAWAFLDLNDNGTYDAGIDSARVRTEGATGGNSAGYYSLTTTQADYTLVAVTDSNTVDTSTGAAYGAGVTLKAPVGASMITPNTTLVENIMSTGLTASQAASKVAVMMGVDASVDLLTYNAYKDYDSMTQAEKQVSITVQKANTTVMATVNTFAAVADGAGMDATAAFNLAMGSMVKQVQAKVVAGDTTILDLADTATMTALTDSIKADMKVAAAADATITMTETNFNAVLDKTVAVVNLVNLKVAAFAWDKVDTNKDLITTLASVKAEITTDSTAYSAANAADAATNLTISSANSVTFNAKVSNKAPTDITMLQNSGGVDLVTSVAMDGRTSISFKDGSSVTEIGMVKGVDATSVGNGQMDYTLVGADAALFKITDAAGTTSAKLEFATATTMAHNTKASYEVGVKVTDGATNAATSTGKSYIEMFNVTVNPSAFSLDSNSVTVVDYNAANSDAAITNTVTTTTTAGKVTIGNGTAKMDLTNLQNLVDGNPSTGTSPVLKFTLDNVPTTSGSGTITATIIEGTDATRTGTENSISLTVNVTYTGDGTIGTITVPTQSATGSYVKGSDGTTVDFTLANGDIDAFSITAANAVTGLPASLDVKMEALYNAFETGAGAGSSASVLTAGTYHVEIATTLPLVDASDDTVTSVSANLELVAYTSAQTDTIMGSARGDTLTGGTSAEAFYGGAGDDTISGGGGVDIIDGGTGMDTMSGGAGADNFVIRAGDGADRVTDFADGSDMLSLTGLTFSQLTVAQGTNDEASNTIISVKSTETTNAGQILMVLEGETYTDITVADFA